MSDPRSAVRKTLADYLAAQLAPAYPQASVSERWPVPGQQLAAQAVTVTIPPAPPVVELHQPRVWNTTPTSGAQGTTVYSWGRVDMGIQVDCWAKAEAVRDQLVDVITGYLNRPPQDTLGLNTNQRLPRKPGLVLRAPTFFNAPVSFLLDPLPSIPESSATAQTKEWRAVWQGIARLRLVDQATVTLIKQLFLKPTFNGGTETDFKLF